MHWLLISTIGKNPGDEYIRRGVQYLIRQIDPEATFRVIDKENRASWTPEPFDKAVWCGMPLFWSNPWSQNHTIAWWDGLLMDWVSERPRDFLVYGAGTFFTRECHHTDALRDSVKALQARSWKIVMRDTCLEQLGINLPVMPCPAYFAHEERLTPGQGTLDLCNLMPHGAHYANLWPEEAAAWSRFVRQNVDLLIESGFQAVAHNEAEFVFARRIGFTAVHRVYGEALDFGILLYRQARRYFGNRMHGGVLARAAGADTWVVGYDTRLGMVNRLGATTNLPSELTRESLTHWLNLTPRLSPTPYEQHQTEALQLLREFVGSEK